MANVVKSGGKTRRAAKMNTLKDWHPDIEEFIEAKTKEEKKAWALIEQGYDGSYNGEAYGSIMYQNENLSVRVSDEFMKAAIEGREWWTKRVTDGKPCEKKDARTLLRKIAEGTHLCGDPGMQFDTTIDQWHTCKGTGRQNSTNPCSRVSLPRQHGLQPRLAEPAEVQEGRRQLRRRALQGGGAHLHHRAGNHRR